MWHFYFLLSFMNYVWLMVEKNEIERYMKVWEKYLVIWNNSIELVNNILQWNPNINSIWKTKTVDKDSIDEIMWIREVWLYNTWFFPHVCICNNEWIFEDLQMANILIEN